MKIEFRFLPIIFIAILGLLFGLWAGLLRLGWDIPSLHTTSVSLSSHEHGPLMVCGFLGVLISLERAVAIRQKWMIAVPILTGAGVFSLLISPVDSPAAAVFTLGSLGNLAILGVMVRREPQNHTIVMALGALAWVVGNTLWTLERSISQVVLWWIAFLALTIGGERIELSRVLHPTPKQIRLFNFLIATLLAGAALDTFDRNLSFRMGGFALLGLGLWFLRFDLAHCNLRHPNPLTRYIAICLFSGYFWLLVAGSIFLWQGVLFAGPIYDAALHAFFVGFVIAMIFGHAPIIFPAILGAPIKFSPIFYAHLGLLHLSLALRIIGDLANLYDLRKWGGLFNEVAILLFLGLTVFSITKGSQSK